jgi:hypothetical protein
VLSFRGAAVVLEPLELCKQVAARAAELEKELRAAASSARATARR